MKEEAAGRSKEGAAAGLGEEEAEAGGRGEEGICRRFVGKKKKEEQQQR